MERFPPIGKLTYFKQQLFEAFQEPNEKFFDYVSRMQILGAKCGANETKVIEAVYKGCHGCYRTWLQSGMSHLGRLSELFQIAKRADAFSNPYEFCGMPYSCIRVHVGKELVY